MKEKEKENLVTTVEENSKISSEIQKSKKKIEERSFRCILILTALPLIIANQETTNNVLQALTIFTIVIQVLYVMIEIKLIYHTSIKLEHLNIELIKTSSLADTLLRTMADSGDLEHSILRERALRLNMKIND